MKADNRADCCPKRLKPSAQNEPVADRILILGNSGSGKSTLALHLAGPDQAVLSLDAVTWNEDQTRRSLEATMADLTAFCTANPSWIIEGCYAEVVAALAPRADELIFLNPGVDVCLAHANARPWEPDKWATPAEQDAFLSQLRDWIASYPTRDDEFGLRAQRREYEYYPRQKREHYAPRTLD